MAKLTIAQLEAELSSRLAGIIASTDTTGLDNAIARAVRFIDSLASYTFLQKKLTESVAAESFIWAPADMNFAKEAKIYMNNVKLSFVPYSELSTYQTLSTLAPMAYSLDHTTTATASIQVAWNLLTNTASITVPSGSQATVTNITYKVTANFNNNWKLDIGITTDTDKYVNDEIVQYIGTYTPTTITSIPDVYAATTSVQATLVGGTGNNGIVIVYVTYDVSGATPRLTFNAAATGTYELFYTKRMTIPATGLYAEIPEHWYDIILDVAQYQQMAKFGMALSEEIKSYAKDRLMQFVREFNSTMGANVNINDEAIRSGGGAE